MPLKEATENREPCIGRRAGTCVLDRVEGGAETVTTRQAGPQVLRAGDTGGRKSTSAVGGTCCFGEDKSGQRFGF